MPGPGPDDLATALASMSRNLLAQETLQDTLDAIVHHAVKLVDGCDVAGILTVRRGQVATLSATDDLAAESDKAQSEAGEGPCFDATWRRQEVFRIEDMATEDRWPAYVPKARALGIGSMMGFMLFTDDENLGALNIYARSSNVFTELSEQVGWLLASHAAVGLANARKDAQLKEAIATRQDIGEAIGIVMERYKVQEEQAFAVLKKASQDSNIRLREVARTVAQTGEIPGARSSSR
ncbi:GAF and ANTAR domain-containing protein [Prauserella muralis]|uniref:Antitermination regulator n=1 Tax=Prauserella muralis TaxID=588067 RepID=A0A2V4B3M5_9PSEU|nr:GAF and ANTAR domain-containing protein [Prauserella muralis]PXY27988.1 antitermination regulator [Prauserella muralis]TWE22223.1 GAF domain-containing protein [Prauserella muralis]